MKKFELLTSFVTLLNAFLVTLWHQSLILSQIQWNMNIFFIIAKFREKRLKIELHINLLQFSVCCFFIVRLSAEVGSSVLHFT